MWIGSTLNLTLHCLPMQTERNLKILTKKTLHAMSKDSLLIGSIMINIIQSENAYIMVAFYMNWFGNSLVNNILQNCPIRPYVYINHLQSLGKYCWIHSLTKYIDKLCTMDSVRWTTIKLYGTRIYNWPLAYISEYILISILMTLHGWRYTIGHN